MQLNYENLPDERANCSSTVLLCDQRNISVDLSVTEAEVMNIGRSDGIVRC